MFTGAPDELVERSEFMKIKHLCLLAFLFLLCCGGLIVFAVKNARADSTPQTPVAEQVIAREKAAQAAWQRKDKAFWTDLVADDFTGFFPQNPYLETDPKVNFLPKFEQMAEQFKLVDFQMYNPHVQVYGDVAILTYTESVTASIAGRTINSTGKVTSIYNKQGNTWRSVHVHESINPGAQ
jgi:ketosteroid isomerase-like protein